MGIKQSLKKNSERKIPLILPKKLWNIIEIYNEYSLEKTLKGHTHWARTVCITPNKRNDFDRERNGKQIISGSRGNIKIWDLKTGKCEKTLFTELIPYNNIYSVYSVCVTPNGKQFISVSGKNIKIWDLKTRECEKMWQKHTDLILSVCVTPNGKQIISGSMDKTIQIWDSESGEFDLPVKTLIGHTHWVTSVCVTPNKRSDFDREGNLKQIISGSEDKTIKIWDLETGKCEKTLRGHNYCVTSVCIHPNMKQIISGSWDKTIKIWDLKTGKCEKTLRGHNHCVTSVCVTLNGKQIISGSSDYTIKIWDSKIGELIQTLEGHTLQVNCVCVYPIKRNDFDQEGNINQIISGSSDKTIKIWTKGIFNN